LGAAAGAAAAEAWLLYGMGGRDGVVAAALWVGAGAPAPAGLTTEEGAGPDVAAALPLLLGAVD